MRVANVQRVAEEEGGGMYDEGRVGEGGLASCPLFLRYEESILIRTWYFLRFNQSIFVIFRFEFGELYFIEA